MKTEFNIAVHSLKRKIWQYINDLGDMKPDELSEEINTILNGIGYKYFSLSDIMRIDRKSRIVNIFTDNAFTEETICPEYQFGWDTYDVYNRYTKTAMILYTYYILKNGNRNYDSYNTSMTIFGNSEGESFVMIEVHPRYASNNGNISLSKDFDIMSHITVPSKYVNIGIVQIDQSDIARYVDILSYTRLKKLHDFHNNEKSDYRFTYCEFEYALATMLVQPYIEIDYSVVGDIKYIIHPKEKIFFTRTCSSDIIWIGNPKLLMKYIFKPMKIS